MPRFVDTSTRGGGAGANERTREATNARALAGSLARALARLVVAVVRLGRTTVFNIFWSGSLAPSLARSLALAGWLAGSPRSRGGPPRTGPLLRRSV